MSIFEPTKNQKGQLLYTTKCTSCSSAQTRGYFCPVSGYVAEKKESIINNFETILTRKRLKEHFNEELEILYYACPVCHVNIKDDQILFHIQQECFNHQQGIEKAARESEALGRRMDIHYQTFLDSVAPAISVEDDDDYNMEQPPIQTEDLAWMEQQRMLAMENTQRVERQNVEFLEFLVEQGQMEPIDVINNQHFTIPPQIILGPLQNMFFDDMELILNNLDQWLKLPNDLKDFEEVKYVRDMALASKIQNHTFSIKLNMNNFRNHFTDMEKMPKKTFELYLKQSTDDRELLSQVTNWKLSKYHGFDEYGYPWFRKKLAVLTQDVHEYENSGQFCVSFLKRLENILSVHENDLQITISPDPMDFAHSLCFRRVFEYCNKIGARPLCFYFYRDDFKVFDFSQVQSQSHGGLYFKILNFPNWFERKVESVNMYSLTRPHQRDVYQEIVKLFNFLWQGVIFQNNKYLPILVIDDGDNPERYSAMMHISWSSIEKPCVCCHTTMQELPFKNFNQLNDQMLLHSFSLVFNHFYTYSASFNAFIADPNIETLKNFFKKLSVVVKTQQSVLTESGQQFLGKGRPLTENEVNSMKQHAPTRKRFPKNLFSFQFPVYLKLISFWKGFFPFYFSIPMEPFHTAYNNIKNTLSYLRENEFLNNSLFLEFVQKLNDTKEKKATRFNTDFHKWHGDQLLQLIRDPNTAKGLCACITEAVEGQNFLKLLVILAFIRHTNDVVINQNKIFEKFTLWQTTITKKFKDYIQPKITYHQIHHLLFQILFFGAISNWDAKICEIKHRKIGRKNLSVFSGREISKQIVHTEVIRENLKLASYEKKDEVQVPFDAVSWLGLVQQW